MLDILKEIIRNAQVAPMRPGTPRHLCVRPVAGKAMVCIGARRSGKSTYMFQQIKRLLADGVGPENILYLNFVDDRLHDLRYDNLDSILEAYFSLYPEKRQTEKVYCFFDEIQMVDGWELFVDRLMRTEDCEVYLTGSSAHMLSREVATHMRGRALSWELFPFSFREFLDHTGVEHRKPLSSKQRLLVQKAFGAYWEAGGFPEAAGLDGRLRVKVHQEYFAVMLFRDLIERHDISHPKALTDLAYRLIDNTSCLYTINKLTAFLASLGHKVPKSTVADYIAWFEDAYFLFTVRLFDASAARANANPKKIYCIDHSLVTSVSSGILVNSRHLLENLVFTALRRATARIHYVRTRNGREVDFVAQMEDRSRLLVQACESLSDPRTRKRETVALNEAMSELGLPTATIVTRGEEERIEVHSGVIDVVPAWRFLLSLPDSDT